MLCIFPLQASNWCQMSEQFLNKMEDKVDLCTSTPQSKELLGELDMYISVTKDQQSARVEQVCGCVCVSVGG